MAEIDVHRYYEAVTAVDIAAVARELLPPGAVQDGSGGRLLCDCPNHRSQSGTSLQVDPQSGLWTCFGCGVGGDVIGLVEFVRDGVVTRGVRGRMPDTHRAARDWLAAKVGLPPLGRAGASPAEVERMEVEREGAEETFRILTRAAQLYSERLGQAPEVAEWLATKYGLGEQDCRSLLIGWSEVPSLFDRLVGEGHEPVAVSSTGLFRFDREDRPVPFFRGRVVFPYWSRGRVVYAIGRRTQWTPGVEWERAKYKKLPVHSEKTSSYVSRAIDNSVLWGEDVLLSRPTRVIITEGVTDAITAWRLGFPVVSPVTVRLKKSEVERIVRRLRGVEYVYLCHDNELSGIGLDAAMQTAAVLEREGIECRVATIPVGVSQEAARSELAGLMSAEDYRRVMSEDPSRRRKLIADSIGDESRAEYAEDLIERAKVDLCEWARSTGATIADLRDMLRGARSPISVAVDAIQTAEDQGEAERVAAAEPILRRALTLKPGEQEDALRRLKGRTGLPITLLRREMSRVRKDSRREGGGGRGGPAASAPSDAPAGSLRELIQRETAAALACGSHPSWEGIAEAAYGWFSDRGALFFRSREGSPFMFFENDLWYMASGGPGARQRYVGMVQRHSGLVPTTTQARTFYAALAALAADRGETRDEFSWIHSDVRGRRFWIALNGEDGMIARVDERGTEPVMNGANADGVILRGHEKLLPISPVPGVDHRDLEELLDRLVGNHLACSWSQRRMLLDWVCALPLLEFSGTRPMMRFEGAAGSGKTFAAKAVTTLIYGHEAQKKSTDAANYVDASRNPLVALDNVETANATPDLLDFLLTSVTGITKEKRSRESDSGTVAERPLCMVLSTGVEPLGGELEEVMGRTIVLEFDAKFQQASFLEPPTLAEIAASRDRVLSAILARASAVLGIMGRNGHPRAMMALRRALGRHDKTRCDEYLALMYLVHVAGEPDAAQDALLDELHPEFLAGIEGLNEVSRKTVREASPVGLLLTAIFAALHRTGDSPGTEYGLDVRDGRREIVDARSTALFLAARRVAKDGGIPCPFSNAVQFGKRLNSAARVLAEDGLEVHRRLGKGGAPLWTIRWRPEAVLEQQEVQRVVERVSGEELSTLAWAWEAASPPAGGGAAPPGSAGPRGEGA